MGLSRSTRNFSMIYHVSVLVHGLPWQYHDKSYGHGVACHDPAMGCHGNTMVTHGDVTPHHGNAMATPCIRHGNTTAVLGSVMLFLVGHSTWHHEIVMDRSRAMPWANIMAMPCCFSWHAMNIGPSNPVALLLISIAPPWHPHGIAMKHHDSSQEPMKCHHVL